MTKRSYPKQKKYLRLTNGKRIEASKWQGIEQSPEYRAAVNSLTNYQRNCWARDGYKGHKAHDPKAVLKYGRFV